VQHPRTADFYIPDIYNDLSAFMGQAVHSATAWPTANKAIYMPIIFRYPATLTSISFIAGNGTGNYDLGFYDGYSKVKYQSSGSTAMTATGGKTLTFTQPIRVDAGRVYFGALALSSTSGTAFKSAAPVANCIMCGLGEQTSSLPLPSTAAPVTATSAYAPLFIIGVR
jgi:hypothetical protein